MDKKVQAKIIEDYQTAKWTIQDLARLHNISVHDVLKIIGEPGMSKVTFSGDMIDSSDAGPGVEMNYGSEVPIDYTVN